MLKIENLTIKRGSLVVANRINATFEKGKVYTILGPNGAGKSSLLKAIFGEITHQGKIEYGHEPLNLRNLANWRKCIGYMPQDTQVEASLTALEVILLGQVDALNMHISDELLAKVADIMQQLNIDHLAHQDIMKLSGGQRQMIMFAQVLLRNPEILLLDEPVSALDMCHQINLLEKVCEYTHKNNLITLMILHDLSLAAQFSNELLLLGGGKIHSQGKAQSVLQPDLISQLYKVGVEILTDSNGLPVIRPQRKDCGENCCLNR